MHPGASSINHVRRYGPTREEVIDEFGQFLRTVDLQVKGRLTAAEVSLIKESLEDWEQRLQQHQAIRPNIRNIIDRRIDWCNQALGIKRRNEVDKDFQIPERDPPMTGQPQVPYDFGPMESWMEEIDFDEHTGGERIDPVGDDNEAVTNLLSKLSPRPANHEELIAQTQMQTQTMSESNISMQSQSIYYMERCVSSNEYQQISSDYQINTLNQMQMAPSLMPPSMLANPFQQLIQPQQPNTPNIPNTPTVFNSELECMIEKINDIWKKAQCDDYDLNDDDLSNMAAGLTLVEKTMANEMVPNLNDQALKKRALFRGHKPGESKKHRNPFDFMKPPKNIGMDTSRNTSKNKRRKQPGNTIIMADTALPHGFCDDLVSTPCKTVKWEDLMQVDDAVIDVI